jgi:hypothetical protein
MSGLSSNHPSPSDRKRSSGVEELRPGLMREWLHDEQIVVYTITQASLPAIHAWSEAINNTLKQWPADRPYLAVYDLSRTSLTYVASLVKDIYSVEIIPASREQTAPAPVNPIVRAKLAVVVSYSLTGRVARILSLKDSGIREHGENFRTFFARQAAMDWLKGFLAPESR